MLKWFEGRTGWALLLLREHFRFEIQTQQHAAAGQ